MSPVVILIKTRFRYINLNFSKKNELVFIFKSRNLIFHFHLENLMDVLKKVFFFYTDLFSEHFVIKQFLIKLFEYYSTIILIFNFFRSEINI